jgi:adenosylcobinamide-phosphate synthase
MSIPIFNVIAAVVLDFIFGDPVGLWHPVVGIGKLVYVLEGRLYQEEDPPALKKKKGILLAMMTTGTVALLV